MLLKPTRIVYSAGSSRAWITRQNRDPFVRQRQSDPASYRSRSAFKLLEIDAKFGNFISKPHVRTVVDLGAAPGGWSQVVAGKLGWRTDSPLRVPKTPTKGFGYGKQGELKAQKHGTWSSPVDVAEPEEEYDPLGEDRGPQPTGRGTIVALDLLYMAPIHGVQALKCDFMTPEAETLIHGILSIKGNVEGKADIILSDMAANSSGNNTHDTESSLEICKAVFSFAQCHLRTAESIGKRKGGVLLMKYFTHPLLEEFRSQHLDPNFHMVKYIKPDASRSESREGYWLCQGWKGLS